MWSERTGLTRNDVAPEDDVHDAYDRVIHSVKGMPPAAVARAAAATTTTADPEPHDSPLIRRAAVALAGMGVRGRMFAATRPRSTFHSQVETPPLSVSTSSSTATSSGIVWGEVFDNAHSTDFAASARLRTIVGSPQDEEEQRRQRPKKLPMPAAAVAVATPGNRPRSCKFLRHLHLHVATSMTYPQQHHQQLHQSQQHGADMYLPFVAGLDELTPPGGLCELLESRQKFPEPPLSARAKASPMGSASRSPPFAEASPACTSVSSCESAPGPTTHFF
ncbi:unnamed protein product [Ectocarpus sp. CCAP 1310/34]|nr:unnamed protein product [Ectocarpus sp. CCAP 1310/34]